MFVLSQFEYEFNFASFDYGRGIEVQAAGSDRECVKPIGFCEVCANGDAVLVEFLGAWVRGAYL